MGRFFVILFLSAFFSSCGQDEVGCEDASDCRYGRQCVQSICVGSAAVVTGNNGVTPKPTGTTNPPFCQNAADCDPDYLVCSFRYGSLSCTLGVEGEIIVDFEKNSEGCQANWSWSEYEGGSASYSCEAFTEVLSACECKFESFGEPSEARFYVRQSLACSDPLEIENNINLFCGGNLQGTLNAYF